MLELAPGLEVQVEGWLEAWRVPGMGLAVVRGGQADWLGAYGYRDLERRLPVTPQTVFPLASCSKAFTALAVGLLVQEGRLAWDTPVSQALPGFRMSDPQASREATVRDLLCHRSGLPAHDLVVYHAEFSRGELLKRLPHLAHSQPLRTAFQYSNLPYIALGCLVGWLGEGDLEGGWERFVERRIFQPLGMRQAGFAPQLEQAPEHARPYQWRRLAFQELPVQPGGRLIGPAGGITASLSDLAAWLRLQLGLPGAPGILAAPARVSPEILAALHTPQVAVQAGDGLLALAAYPEIEGLSYALGWYTWQYRGRRMVFHGGELDGYRALVSFIPEAQLGVAVLLNAHRSVLQWLLALTVYDRLLGLPAVPWEERLAERFRPPSPGSLVPEEQPAAPKRGKLAPEEPPTAGEVAEYLGEYAHPGYGRITIASTPGGLAFQFQDLALEIARKAGDVFLLYYAPYEVRLPVRFERDAAGQVVALEAPFEPSLPPLRFARL